MLKRIAAMLCIASVLFIVGCAAHVHNIGDGPPRPSRPQEEIVERQWYLLWGLVPINEIDTNDIAGDATDYQIVTSMTVVDWLVAVVLSPASIYSRTVVVKK
ncbi:MAG: hypothetical protein OXI43_23365 [Candidatus Poribacteria bacterium]|nr:hypothetical protein [Candidatus Poribacteria bacterium]